MKSGAPEEIRTPDPLDRSQQEMVVAKILTSLSGVDREPETADLPHRSYIQSCTKISEVRIIAME